MVINIEISVPRMIEYLINVGKMLELIYFRLDLIRIFI